MDRFSLDQISFLSGLPSQTIIFWIKRYNAFKKEQLQSSLHQRFSTDDLHRILNISTLFHLNKKYSLEIICNWDNEQLQTKVEIEILKNLFKEDDIINQLIASCLTYNEKRFNLIIDTTLNNYTTIAFYECILYPFLKRLYSIFADKSEKPAQFYYMKNLLKKKFFTLIDKNSFYVNKSNSILLFLPENEYNEIGLLFSNLILIENGFLTYYIGPNQKIKTIEQVINDVSPDILLTYLPSNESLNSFKNMINHFDYLDKNLILFGSKTNIKNIKNNNCLKIHDLNELYQNLDLLEAKKMELN